MRDLLPSVAYGSAQIPVPHGFRLYSDEPDPSDTPTSLKPSEAIFPRNHSPPRSCRRGDLGLATEESLSAARQLVTKTSLLPWHLTVVRLLTPPEEARHVFLFRSCCAACIRNWQCALMLAAYSATDLAGRKGKVWLLGRYARKILRPPDLPVMLPGSRVGNSRWLRQVRVWQGSWWWNSVKTILNCLL